MGKTYWQVQPEWRAETAFIIGGGPSVTPSMLEAIRGRRVVAVNMAYTHALWADYLFFADQRWWDREMKERQDLLLKEFKGTIVSTCEVIDHPQVRFLKRIVPTRPSNGLAMARDTVSMERTSVQGAMNLCYHLGAKRIVVLGLDNRDAPNGRIHWHDEYPWVRHSQSWDIKGEQLGYGAAALAKAGIEIINCSPVSTLKYWPIRPLEDVLKEVDSERRIP